MAAFLSQPALGRHEPAPLRLTPAHVPTGGPAVTLLASSVCGVFVSIPRDIVTPQSAGTGGLSLLLLTAFVAAGVLAAGPDWRRAHRGGLRTLSAAGALVLAFAGLRHAGRIDPNTGVFGLLIQGFGLAAWWVAALACLSGAAGRKPLRMRHRLRLRHARRLRQIRRRLRAGHYDRDAVLNAAVDRLLTDLRRGAEPAAVTAHPVSRPAGSGPAASGEPAPGPAPPLHRPASTGPAAARCASSDHAIASSRSF